MNNQLVFVLLMFNFIFLSCQKNESNIYVSPIGNDSSMGDKYNPVLTLQKAAELVRERGRTEPITVYLADGTYRLSNALELGVEDGGVAKASVTWAAIEGESPIISGGVALGNWKIEEDGLWSAELPKDYKGTFRSLYINNKRAIRARFPNSSFLKVAKAGKDNRTNFFFNENEIPIVKNGEELELAFIHDWSITRIGVKSIDYSSNQLTAVDSIGARLPFFTLTNWGKHPRYYLENTLEFCDSPGEWYCNFKERKIYYYPLKNERIEAIKGVIPVASKLITIKGNKEGKVGFIKFKGITFEHTAWQIPTNGYCGVQACMYNDRGSRSNGWERVPAAIELDLADHCLFIDCTIRHTGGSGIWIRQNCNNNKIENSHLYDISGNGINIGEGRDRIVNGESWWKTAPGQVTINSEIRNSLIEDCGKQFYGAIGIWGGLVSNTKIEYNEIRNLPYTGISIGWMWNPTPTPCRENIINGNHIHHIMNKLSDGGGIYCLGLQPNSKITNNLIHDVTVNAGRAESNGMFLDEGITGALVENNIVYNIARSPLRFHKAFKNTVKNNVFACGDNTPAIRYNRTEATDIEKIGNVILSQSSKSDIKKLDESVKKWKKEINLKVKD